MFESIVVVFVVVVVAADPKSYYASVDNAVSQHVEIVSPVFCLLFVFIYSSNRTKAFQAAFFYSTFEELTIIKSEAIQRSPSGGH